MELYLGPCSPQHFESVKKYIHEFELDDRELKQQEFIIALRNQKLVGFGRIREYATCSEMCSMGVITSERSKGVAKHLTEALIRKVTQPLFLVCIIPSFFEPFNFTVVNEYPLPLQQKLDYCTGNLPVEEPYVVMQFM